MMFQPQRPTKLLIAAALLLAGQAAPTHAAILYGDFSDIPPGSVMYTDVTESSTSDPVPPPRYGAPDVSIDLMDFDPTSFGATATGANPSADLMEGQLNFGFETIPGKGLKSLAISEGGDFTLFGSGTSVSAVSAGLFVRVDITEVNGVLLSQPIVVIGSSMFTADLANSPGMNQPWGNTLLVDFGPALLNAGFDPLVDRATAGEAVVNNSLVAVSEFNPSTVSQVVKKDFKVIPQVTNAVPEPGSIALLGLAGLAMIQRRRR